MFKVGDKVRIIANRAGSVNKIGEIGVITELYTNQWIEKREKYAKVKVDNKRISCNYSYMDDIAPLIEDINKNIKVL